MIFMTNSLCVSLQYKKNVMGLSASASCTHSHRSVVYYRGDLDCCSQDHTRTKSYHCENENLMHHTMQHDCAQVIKVYVYE